MFYTLYLTWSSENENFFLLWGCCEISWRAERPSWSGNVWQRLVEVCDTIALWEVKTDSWKCKIQTCGNVWHRLVEVCDTPDLWEVETDDWLNVLQLTQLESTALFLRYKFRCSPSKSRGSWNFNVSQFPMHSMWVYEGTRCWVRRDGVLWEKTEWWPTR